MPGIFSTGKNLVIGIYTTCFIHGLTNIFTIGMTVISEDPAKEDLVHLIFPLSCRKRASKRSTRQLHKMLILFSTLSMDINDLHFYSLTTRLDRYRKSTLHYKATRRSKYHLVFFGRHWKYFITTRHFVFNGKFINKAKRVATALNFTILEDFRKCKLSKVLSFIKNSACNLVSEFNCQSKK